MKPNPDLNPGGCLSTTNRRINKTLDFVAEHHIVTSGVFFFTWSTITTLLWLEQHPDVYEELGAAGGNVLRYSMLPILVLLNTGLGMSLDAVIYLFEKFFYAEAHSHSPELPITEDEDVEPLLMQTSSERFTLDDLKKPPVPLKNEIFNALRLGFKLGLTHLGPTAVVANILLRLKEGNDPQLIYSLSNLFEASWPPVLGAFGVSFLTAFASLPIIRQFRFLETTIKFGGFAMSLGSLALLFGIKTTPDLGIDFNTVPTLTELAWVSGVCFTGGGLLAASSEVVLRSRLCFNIARQNTIAEENRRDYDADINPSHNQFFTLIKDYSPTLYQWLQYFVSITAGSLGAAAIASMTKLIGLLQGNLTAANDPNIETLQQYKDEVWLWQYLFLLIGVLAGSYSIYAFYPSREDTRSLTIFTLTDEPDKADDPLQINQNEENESQFLTKD